MEYMQRRISLCIVCATVNSFPFACRFVSVVKLMLATLLTYKVKAMFSKLDFQELDVHK